MVAPWMEYGSLLAYIRANPDKDRYNLVSIECTYSADYLSTLIRKQCTQIAEGLVYMHGLGVVSNLTFKFMTCVYTSHNGSLRHMVISKGYSDFDHPWGFIDSSSCLGQCCGIQEWGSQDH
jgi:hypothetical protein